MDAEIPLFVRRRRPNILPSRLLTLYEFRGIVRLGSDIVDPGCGT
jgi:hypothetical protein